MVADDMILVGVSSAQLDTIEHEPLTAEHDAIGAGGQADATHDPAHPLFGIDDDVTSDLAALGIELTPNVERELDDPHREAMAALLLRRAGGVERELGQVQAAMDLELAAIRAHHERRMRPLRERYTQLIGFVQTLAEITEWKKRKSRATPFGTYGVKDTAATVECTDRAAVTAWATASRPELVKVVATLALPDARERFSEAELAQQKTDVEWGKLKPMLDVDGELPPGVVRVDARREAYAAPAPLPTEA